MRKPYCLRPRIFTLSVLVALLSFFAFSHLTYAIYGLPAGFTSDLFIGGLNYPTAIAFAPNGKVYIAQKDGRVRVWNSGTLQAADFVNISGQVNNYGDRGLLGIAVHPNFATTPYVYLLFTYDPPEVTPDGSGARVSRLIRVTADAANSYNTAVPNSAVILLGVNSVAANIGNPNSEDGVPSCENINGYTGYVPDCLPTDTNTHAIGTVMFGQDGALFVGNGDGAHYGYVDARALRALDTGSLSGKILRIDPITGQGLPDNPFVNGDLTSNQSKVYSLGLRNPFRFTISPYDGKPYIGDVGWNTWEEINTGRGANFGWPCYEGDSSGSAQQAGYGTSGGTAARCSQLYTAGSSAVQAPLYAYSHNGGGASVTGGAFYSGSSYPSEYHGALFYADFNNDWIKYLTFSFDPQGGGVGPPTTLASDDFNHVGIGQNWTGGLSDNYNGVNAPLDIVNNRVRSTSTAIDASMIYTAVALPNDQWAQATLATLTGSGVTVPRLLLRMNASGPKNGYECAVGRNTGFTTRLGKWINGGFINLGQDNAVAWQAGDVLRCEIIGSTMKVYQNGVLVRTGTDTSFTGGNAGITFYAPAVTNAEFDDFSVGGFAPGTGATVATSHDFAFDLSSGGPAQLIAGPDSNLYYINLVFGTNASEVRVIRYASGSNVPPNAVVTASPTNGPAPLTVNFSGAGSSDPNGDPLTYSWNFGDGGTSGPSATATVSHTYSSAGNYTAVLTVTDSKNASGTASVIITSGNTAPVATINSPANNSLYTIGTPVSLVGQATDQQQGSLSGGSLAWVFNVHHNDHIHFNYYPTLFGTQVSFTPLDHGLNTWIEACLTATDSGGLSNTSCINLLPATTQLTFQTSPVAGLSLTIDGVTNVTPFTVNAPVNSSVEIIAPASQTTAQGTFVFQSWSDNGTATHAITVTSVPGTYTATYAPSNTTLTFLSNPSGLQLIVGNTVQITPFTVTATPGSSLTINAPSPQPNNKVFNWVFQSWSDGGSQTHSITVGPTTSYTATFKKVKK